MSFRDLFCGSVNMQVFFYHLQQSNNIITFFCWKLSDSFFTFFLSVVVLIKPTKFLSIAYLSESWLVYVSCCCSFSLVQDPLTSLFTEFIMWLCCSFCENRSSEGLMPFHVRIPAKCHPQWEASPNHAGQCTDQIQSVHSQHFVTVDVTLCINFLIVPLPHIVYEPIERGDSFCLIYCFISQALCLTIMWDMTDLVDCI